MASKYFHSAVFLCGVMAQLALPAHAEVLVIDHTITPQPAHLYQHPLLPSLVFVNPESRGQAILPPAPVFIAPPPLIWRAPGTSPAYTSPALRAFNQPGNPSNRDMASYNLARAHAMSQNLYRENAPVVLYGGASSLIWYGGAGAFPLLWNIPAYPPVPPGQSHPSNRDNASYLIDRAHRYSQDAYRKP
jgi:hypothetical protein